MKALHTLVAAVALISCTSPAWSDLAIGQKAPEFSLSGSDGKTYSSATYKGRWMVLEWFNPQCPFVKKHYVPGNMQRLQGAYTQRGVIWFSIDSSAAGKEGFITPPQAAADRQQRGAQNTATLLDPSGTIGHLYGAKSTPHLFIINPEGKLVYQGAIDDHPSANPNDIPQSKNYVAQALDEGLSGRPISQPQTKAYGCFVKYP